MAEKNDIEKVGLVFEGRVYLVIENGVAKSCPKLWFAHERKHLMKKHACPLRFSGVFVQSGLLAWKW